MAKKTFPPEWYAKQAARRKNKSTNDGSVKYEDVPHSNRKRLVYSTGIDTKGKTFSKRGAPTRVHVTMQKYKDGDGQTAGNRKRIITIKREGSKQKVYKGVSEYSAKRLARVLGANKQDMNRLKVRRSVKLL